MITHRERHYALAFSNLTIELHTSTRFSLAVMIYVCYLFPVFDKGDVGMTLCSGHSTMIAPFLC